MTPLQARRWAQRVALATAKFKSHPLYPLVQVQIHERSQKLGEKFPPPLKLLSQDSLKCALGLLQIHAEAYLTMVDDMDLQDAYSITLSAFADKAWEQFSQIPVNLAIPGDLRYFQELVAHWKNEGFKRIAARQQQQPESLTVPNTAGVASSDKSTRERVDAFLVRVNEQSNRKITRTDLWQVAGYSDATEFERFQRDDSKNAAAKTAFNRILNMEPGEFLGLLAKKQQRR